MWQDVHLSALLPHHKLREHVAGAEEVIEGYLGDGRTGGFWMKKLADLGGVSAARTEDVDSPPKLVSAYVGFGEHHKEFMNIFFLISSL